MQRPSGLAQDLYLWHMCKRKTTGTLAGKAALARISVGIFDKLLKRYANAANNYPSRNFKQKKFQTEQCHC